jgi:hypothetical protein
VHVALEHLHELLLADACARRHAEILADTLDERLVLILQGSNKETQQGSATA